MKKKKLVIATMVLCCGMGIHLQIEAASRTANIPTSTQSVIRSEVNVSRNQKVRRLQTLYTTCTNRVNGGECTYHEDCPYRTTTKTTTSNKANSTPSKTKSSTNRILTLNTQTSYPCGNACGRNGQHVEDCPYRTTSKTAQKSTHTINTTTTTCLNGCDGTGQHLADCPYNNRPAGGRHQGYGNGNKNHDGTGRHQGHGRNHH